MTWHSLSRPKDKLEWPNSAWWYLSSNAALSICWKLGVRKYCYLWWWYTAAVAPAQWLSQHSSPTPYTGLRPRDLFSTSMQWETPTAVKANTDSLCVRLYSSDCSVKMPLKFKNKQKTSHDFFFVPHLPPSWTDLNRTRESEVHVTRSSQLYSSIIPLWTVYLPLVFKASDVRFRSNRFCDHHVSIWLFPLLSSLISSLPE